LHTYINKYDKRDAQGLVKSDVSKTVYIINCKTTDVNWLRSVHL